MVERKQTLEEEWKATVDRRLDEGDTRMDGMGDAIQRIDKGVADILQIFEALRGFVTVGGWLGGAVKWIAAFVVACGVIYWVWKTGGLPRKD